MSESLGLADTVSPPNVGDEEPAVDGDESEVETGIQMGRFPKLNAPRSPKLSARVSVPG